MLSKKAIDDFKAIYKKEFGVEISDKEAQEKGEKLLGLFRTIYRPIPKKWIQEAIRKKKISERKVKNKNERF